MNQFSLNKFISGTLIILVILSFFFGFYLDESSTGAGGHTGDFEHIYTNLEFFLKHDLVTSISNPNLYIASFSFPVNASYLSSILPPKTLPVVSTFIFIGSAVARISPLQDA